MATKTINKKDTEKNFEINLDQVKSTVKEVNGFVLKTTEELVDSSINRTSEWQKVSEKAIKGGFKLVAKQQDLMFTILENGKIEFSKSVERLKKIFN